MANERDRARRDHGSAADINVHSPDSPPLDRRSEGDSKADEQTGNPGRDYSHDKFEGDERAKE